MKIYLVVAGRMGKVAIADRHQAESDGRKTTLSYFFTAIGPISTTELADERARRKCVSEVYNAIITAANGARCTNALWLVLAKLLSGVAE
jgi:hypothetical protein